MTPKQKRFLMRCCRIPIESDEPVISFNDDIGSYGNCQQKEEAKITRTISNNISLLLNGLKTKYVKRDIKLKEQSNYSSSHFSNKFIVTRILGHPE